MKWAAAALLTVMAALMWHSASGDSQTYDEAVHLVSGYSYWTRGDFRLNPEHPPLSKLLQAAPLLTLAPKLPIDSDAWKRGDTAEVGRLFVHHNDASAATLLMRGRVVTMLLALMLGVAIFWWTRLQAGILAAGIALFFYALDPNFIAHGHYVTSDVPVALAVFVSAITWLRYLETGSRRDFAFAALALGAAAATKFSALYLVPVHLVVGLLYQRDWKFAKRYVLVTLAAVAVVAVCYGTTSVRAFLVNPRKPLATLRDNHPYATGVKALWAHNDYKQPAYLAGEVYRGGRWDYFPVAFLVKTPAALLIALLFVPFFYCKQWALFVYPAAYLAVTMAADINIGARHILPIYPFLYVAVGTALVQLKRGRTAVLAALAALQIFETARVHPGHVAFFNVLSGGPDNGPNLMLDSNLDWGQDLWRLKQFLTAQGTDTAALAYFGSALPEDYGIRSTGLPGVWDTGEIAKIDGWAAISMTELYDVYFDKPTYTWLRERKPTARVGRSILVYDLRKRP